MNKPHSVLVTIPVVTDRDRAERADELYGPVRNYEAVEVSTVNLWVLANLGSSWQAAYRLVEQHGGVVVGEVRVLPIPGRTPKNRLPWTPGDWAGALKGVRATVPLGGITASILKSVRIGAHITECLTDLQPIWQASPESPTSSSPYSFLRWMGVTDMERRPPASRPGPGRRGLALAEYRRLAAAYIAAIRSGSRTPTQDAASALRIAPALARDRIYRARSLGLLGPTRKGRAGGTRPPIPSARPETQAVDAPDTLRRTGRSAD